MPITTSSFHSLLQRIRICLLSLLFQGSPYSSQQLFDNCSTQLRKLQRAKLPTTDQADRASPIMAAFMPQRAVSPVRCASTSAEKATGHGSTHTVAYSYIIQHLQGQIKRLTSSLNFLPLRFVYLPVTIYLPLDLWQPAIGMGHLVA